MKIKKVKLLSNNILCLKSTCKSFPETHKKVSILTILKVIELALTNLKINNYFKNRIFMIKKRMLIFLIWNIIDTQKSNTS